MLFIYTLIGILCLGIIVALETETVAFIVKLIIMIPFVVLIILALLLLLYR